MCPRAHPQVIPLRHKVPVPRTEQPFVFQSQPVETRGRWKGRGKEEQDEKAVRRSCTANTDYLYGKTSFTAAVRRSVGQLKGEAANNKKLAAFERGEEAPPASICYY